MNKDLKGEYYQGIFGLRIPSYGCAARIVVRTTVTYKGRTTKPNRQSKRASQPKDVIQKVGIIGADSIGI